jgi:transposase
LFARYQAILELGIRRNLIYKWREQLNTKQDKAFKRTANNTDTPYHKATHSELFLGDP